MVRGELMLVGKDNITLLLLRMIFFGVIALTAEFADWAGCISFSDCTFCKFASDKWRERCVVSWLLVDVFLNLELFGNSDSAANRWLYEDANNLLLFVK